MTEPQLAGVAAEALAWLDARPEAPPPELRSRMAEALVGTKATTVPGALAEGALSCLQSTVSAPQERETALDLLAADALLTYALEAAGEISAAALAELTRTFGPNALAELLPEEQAPGSGAEAAPEAPPTDGAGAGEPVSEPPPADGAGAGESASEPPPRETGADS